MLYDRIVDTVLHKRYPEKERIEPIRGRLAAVALGMHTGEGLGQQRAAPEARHRTTRSISLLQAYQQLDGCHRQGTERYGAGARGSVVAVWLAGATR